MTQEVQKPKMFAKTRKALYYGLALDSMSRPIQRTKKLVGSTFSSMKAMTANIFRTATFTKASTIEEVINTHDNCAGTMVGTVIVILFYTFFTIKTSNNTYALIVNSVITLTFAIYFVCNLIVYLRCQQVLIEHKGSVSISKDDHK